MAEPVYSLEPTYKFLGRRGIWNIQVDIPAIETPEEIKKSLLEEAKKDSLFAIAYINKLADHHLFAQQIADLYQGYREFFEKRDGEKYLGIVQKILKDPYLDSLVFEMGHYISQILSGEKVSSSLGQKFTDDLIPSIKDTLRSTGLTKVYPETKIKVPEMTGSHCAFPDITKYQGTYYVCFREAQTHAAHGDLGKVRLLRGNYNESTHTWKWEHLALLSSDKYDFRDPKFFVNENQQLCMVLDGSIIGPKDTTDKMVPHVAYQKNGQWIVEKAKIDCEAKGKKGQWIWRVTWNPLEKAGYGFAYNIDGLEKSPILTLMKTTDAKKFEKVTEIRGIKPEKALSEATICFKSDGKAVALIRGQEHGLIGTSSGSPYDKWSFKVIPFRLGGPNFLFAKDESKMWAATRHFFLRKDNRVDETTIVAQMTEKRLIPLLMLKSSGDSSYPGMVLEDDGSMTIVCYSSSRDSSKSNIYIVRVRE